MKNERVIFKVKGSCEMQIGQLVKDKLYEGGFKVMAADGKSTYCITLLKKLKKF